MESRSRLGLRLSYPVLLMAIFVALPILVGVGAYAADINQRLNVAQAERVGLLHVAVLDRLLRELSAYRAEKLCTACSTLEVRQARAAVDRNLHDLDAVDRFAPIPGAESTALRTSWNRYRAQTRFNTATDAQTFANLTKLFVRTSDASQLTYDPDTAGIDLADELTYRLPQAIDRLERAGLLAQSGTGSVLERRLDVVEERAQSHVLLSDMLDDLGDATNLEPAQAGALVMPTHTVMQALAQSDRMFSAFVREPLPRWSPSDAMASARSLRSLYALDRASLPVLASMIDRRALQYRRELWLLLLPGLAAACAAFLIVIFSAIAFRQRASLRFAERLASIDALTGVMSRRQFDTVLEKERRRCERERAPLSVILIDVDHFKSFNDAYGHVAGDVCLRRIAQAAAACTGRTQDAVARYGGEEFAAILPWTDLEGALKVAQRIRTAIFNLAIPHARTSIGRITASIGVASLVPNRMTTNDALVGAADYWLYRAKDAGRNRVRAHGYGPGGADANERPASA